MEGAESKKSSKSMNKMLMILGAALVLIVLVGIGFYVMGGNTEDEDQSDAIEQVQIRQIQPEDIGFELSASADGQNVLIDITKPEGIDTIEYSVNYTAEGDLPRGTIGEIDITAGEELPKKVYLGTCSSGTCKPDKGIESVTVEAKVNYTNGDVAQLEDSVDMTE